MKQKKARVIKPVKQSQQCYLYQHIARFVTNLDKLPDAAAVKKQLPKTAPADMVEMVF